MCSLCLHKQSERSMLVLLCVRYYVTVLRFLQHVPFGVEAGEFLEIASIWLLPFSNLLAVLLRRNVFRTCTDRKKKSWEATCRESSTQLSLSSHRGCQSGGRPLPCGSCRLHALEAVCLDRGEYASPKQGLVTFTTGATSKNTSKARMRSVHTWALSETE